MRYSIGNTFKNKVLNNGASRKRVIAVCLQAVLALGSVAVISGAAQASSINCASHIPDPTCH